MFDVPQKITLEDLSESKSALEDKSADRSHSVNSMQTATHETTNVAVYEVSNTERVIAPVASAWFECLICVNVGLNLLVRGRAQLTVLAYVTSCSLYSLLSLYGSHTHTHTLSIRIEVIFNQKTQQYHPDT